MNSVSCLAWVKKGAAKSCPDRLTLDDADLKKIIDEQGDRLKKIEVDSDSDDSEELPHKGDTKSTKSSPSTSNKINEDDDDDVTAKYGLDDYEDEDVANGDSDDEGGAMGIGGVAFYGSNKDDPYIAKNVKLDSDEEEDLKVLEDDNLLAVGKVHGDYCQLEVYLYNEKDDNLYCHHDILLPSFPLALEWMDFDPGESAPGNLVAMGTMEPDIEIWDLDVIDSLEPAYVLKGAEKKTSKKKKKKTSDKGHTDAILDLAWNSTQRTVLASASADFTIGIWDLESGEMAACMSNHTEKVQSVAWHPVEAQTLLSGSFDHTARVYDCRTADESQKMWTLAGEVERVLWNIHNPYCFLASTDSGHIYGMDVRETRPLFTLKAHLEAVTGVSLSSSLPGCMVTASEDKTLKVWDIRANTPVQIWKKEMKMGELHCASLSPDSPLVLGIGGVTEMRVLNLKKNSKICEHWGITPLEPSVRMVKKALKGLDSDSDSDDLGLADGQRDDEDEDDDDEHTEASAAANNETSRTKSKKKKKKKKPSTSSFNKNS